MKKIKELRAARKIKKYHIVLCVVLLLIIITIVQNFSIVTTGYRIRSEKLPADFKGLRIVQISDVHMVRNEKTLDKIAAKAAAANPDIIAITGDLVDTDNYLNSEMRALTVELCARLAKIADCYYIYGNHEIMLLDDPERNRFRRAVEDAGVVVANNTLRKLEKDGVTFDLIAIQDPATLYKDPVYSRVGGKTEKILRDLSLLRSEENFSVLLAHRPEQFSTYSSFEIDLSLTGHAHGGQVRLPFLNFGLYAPSQGIFPKYTSGVHRIGNSSMIVSRGIGNSKFPVRIFNTPEIVVVDILPK